MKKVKDLGLKPLEIVRPSMLVINALRMMETKRIHSLLVFDGERFEGIITMSDIATKAFGNGSMKVSAIITPAEQVVSVGYEDDLKKCAALMRERKIHHLVVNDLSGKVAGVISSIDLMVADDITTQLAAETADEMPRS